MTTLHSDFYRFIKTELWALEGPDALRFLNGITTPHLSRPAMEGARHCGRGLFLDPKGKMLAPFIFLRESEQRVRLRLDIGCHTREPAIVELNQSLFDNVSQLIIADDLTITRRPVRVLQGWGKDFHRFAAGESLPALRPDAQDRVFVAGTYADAHCLPAPHLGVDAFELWPTAGHDELPPVDGLELSPSQVDAIFFAARYLEFPNQLYVGDLPLEFGFSDAISFFKGCYRGQEIIARVTFRGKIVKGLCELSFARPLEPRDTQLVNASDQIVGEVRVLNEDRTRALGLLRFDVDASVTTALTKTPLVQTTRLVEAVNELFR